MSASNWAQCPCCLYNAERAVQESAETVAALYGKVPIEKYVAARAAQLVEAPAVGRSFREDYEVYGASSGTVTVRYSGICTACGLSLSFEHEHPLWEEPK